MLKVTVGMHVEETQLERSGYFLWAQVESVEYAFKLFSSSDDRDCATFIVTSPPVVGNDKVLAIVAQSQNKDLIERTLENQRVAMLQVLDMVAADVRTEMQDDDIPGAFGTHQVTDIG